MDGPLPRGGTPAAFPQDERGVELDDGHALRPRAAALRARSPLPMRVNRGRRCISLDAAVCARISAGGYCGPACGRAPAGSGGFRRKWAPILPWSWTSVRFSAGLFAVGSADLGKCRRRAAFRADLACKTAQKFADGVRESLGERGGTVVSKNAAFDKQYLSGRYGADPYLTRIEEWE